MKHIKKGNEPDGFVKWKNSGNENWKPAYEHLKGHGKILVLNELKKDQGYICCYCERSIDHDDCHIEHFKPQHTYPELSLEYNNMLCSCQRNIEKGTPLHCGSSKGHWYDENLMVSPLDPTCEDAFKFTFDGLIKPKDDKDSKAIKTISVLNLGINKLNTLRKKAIEPFIDETISEEELGLFVKNYLELGNDGRYNEFYSAIKYLFA